MSFDWKLYVQLADELISYQKTANFQEAYLRTAISRSYYGVFCLARNFLVRKNISVPRTNTHKFVREKYKASPSKVERKIGSSLERLSQRRNMADYDDGTAIDIGQAKIGYEMALRTMQGLRNIGAI
jgi:uncharacterized protein (UPF0332 family)